jgi:hypothetical protein
VELLTHRKNGLYTCLALLRTFMVAMLCLYLNPVASTASSNAGFSRFLFAALASMLVQIINNHGRPRWDQAYAVSLFTDPLAQQCFFTFVFISARPYTLAAVSILLAEALSSGMYVRALLTVVGQTGMVAKATAMLSNALSVPESSVEGQIGERLASWNATLQGSE